MTRTVTAILAVVAFLIAAALGALAFVWSGWYDIAATKQHTQPVYTLLEKTGRQSIRLRAASIVPPPLDSPALVARGAACYVEKCLQCHGGPGVAQGEIGRSMQPLPGPLVGASAKFGSAELYWITRHGIRLSGMPAWEFRLKEEEIWDVVAFLQRLPNLTPQAYAETAQKQSRSASCGRDVNAAPTRTPDVVRGKQALYQYACSACHTIPGVTSSFPNVGPPLEGIASRTLIAGKLSNTHDNMVLWLRGPNAVKPNTAMPNLHVTEEDAADMAAYLATLR